MANGAPDPDGPKGTVGRGPLLGAAAAMLGALLWWWAGAGAPSSASTASAHPLAQETATPQTLVFQPRVVVTPLDGPPREPIDVTGYVVDRLGQAVVGAQVRVSSPGWEATSPTRAGGTFNFVLTRGEFTILLVDRPSRPASIKVDGASRIQIVFQEGGPPPSPATVSPTATVTPSPTPVLEVSTPVIVGASPTGTPTTTPKVAVAPLAPSTSGTSWEPWTSAFFRGVVVGGGLFLLGLLVILLRRGGQG